MENKSKKIKIQLPHCILSKIFSKLSLKDLVKTSTLSKLWRHEWQLRTNLNFDLCNMFDHNKVQKLPKSLPLLQGFQSEFVTRLDQFMLHFQGDVIESIRVQCPISYEEHSDVIERLISKGIAKGANRIELFLSYKTRFRLGKPCNFSLDLLSGTDSLTYLHLQNCSLKPPMEFSGLRNLRILVLQQQIDMRQNLLEGLLSNCIYLADFTLDNCQFMSDLKIISPTLFRLNVINCQFISKWNIDIIASNLSCIEYSCIGDSVYRMNIDAHMLSKFSFRGCKIYKPVGFSGLKNVTKIVFDGLSEILQPPTNIVSLLFSECLQLEDVTFKNFKRIVDMNIIGSNLRHLKIIECGYTQRIDINALNLASFEYSGNTRGNISVTAPMLLRVFWNAARREINPHPFGPMTTLQHIENLAMIISTSQVVKLTEVLVQYQNLRQLELFIDGAYDPNMDYFWILDIAMASQHLQKLSLTIRNLHLENSHMVGFERQRKEYSGFSHNGLKYVELRGCVCSINVIEIASCLLRNASSLKQITFGSLDKFYKGAGRWTKGSVGCCWFERNLIHEKLKDEVHEPCQLIIF